MEPRNTSDPYGASKGLCPVALTKGSGRLSMYDVVALGESLIDFAPEGVNAAGVPLYSCNPGGALANLLAMIAKLGGKCAFMGKVGADAFGRFLENVMTEAGIDICGVKWDASVHTTIGLFI